MNQKLSILLLTLIAVAFGGLSACQSSKNPAQISFTSPMLYPEGVAWDADNRRFLVTSIHKGEIGSVKDDGSYSVFASDPRLVSSVGIKIDASRDRVLVCNADPGASKFSSKKTTGKLAGLAAFKLSTGKLIKYVNLAEGIEGGHFCNDLTIASDGTAYLSDSFSPIIYKVDKNYNSSVFINHKTFSGQSFNLNGMVVKDDYLLAVKMNSGQLFKIPLDNPSAFSEVKTGEKFYGADGAVLMNDGSLAIIAGNNAYVGATPAVATNKVIRLESNDNWATAKIVKKLDTGDVFATTGDIRNGELYVIHAMLQVLFNPKTKKHLDKFVIRRYKI